MSMRDYAVNDYGLILNDEVMRDIASKVCDNFSAIEYDLHKYDFIEEIMYEYGAINYISSFTGEAIVEDEEGDYYSSDYYDNETIYIVFLTRYPSLFRTAYKSMDDIVAEMKKQVGKVLGDDFDYVSNIRHVVGTYYG